MRNIEQSLERYVPLAGDIIITKNGKPFKTAIMDIFAGRNKILVNGNCFIVRPNKDKVYPLYLKCFFESWYGNRALESIATDSITPSLSISALDSIIIPNIPMDEQIEIAKEYEEIQTRLRDCKREIKRCTQEAEHIFDRCFEKDWLPKKEG